MKLIIVLLISGCIGLTACSEGTFTSSSDSSYNLFGDMDLTCGSESCME